MGTNAADSETQAVAAMLRAVADSLLAKCGPAPAPPPAAPPVTPRWMKLRAYAGHRGVGLDKVRQWVALGLPVWREERTIRVNVEAADAWLNASGAKFAARRARAVGAAR